MESHHKKLLNQVRNTIRPKQFFDDYLTSSQVGFNCHDSTSPDYLHNLMLSFC